MVQIQELTYDEQVQIYNKMTKKELIAMLIEANRQIVIMSRASRPTISHVDIDLDLDLDEFTKIVTHNKE